MAGEIQESGHLVRHIKQLVGSISPRDTLINTFFLYALVRAVVPAEL